MYVRVRVRVCMCVYVCTREQGPQEKRQQFYPHPKKACSIRWPMSEYTDFLVFVILNDACVTHVRGLEGQQEKTRDSVEVGGGVTIWL